MAKTQNPVIVVPGITASVLEDRYPIEPEEVWTAVMRKNFERITLHPDDLRFEAIELARVGARNPFSIVYDDLVEALRHDLSPKKELPTPVFAFGYDWRRDNLVSAAQLAAMVDEVLARTRLLPHYKKSPPQCVDLVAHSMGGLVVAAYLHGCQTGKVPGVAKGPSRLGKVVTIGTPFCGAVDAIHKMATGMGTLTGPAPRDREREAARMMPALYQLLPSFAGAVTKGGKPVDIFARANWQPSVIETMREFIRAVAADIEAEKLLDGFLASAKAFAAAANGLDLGKVLDGGADDWLAIVGLGEKTAVRVELEDWKGKPWFKLLPPENGPAGSEDTGDGTVPFRGACPGFLPKERLVGVTRSDLSMWEVGDQALLRSVGLHGTLANVNLVQRLAIKHLRSDFSADFWGHPVPGVQKPQWPKWIEVRPLE